MGTCIFKTSEIKKLVEHTLNAKDHREDWVKNKAPALFFVHDHGIYCMSNGVPNLVENENNFVSYAKDCNPDKDEDFYENARFIVGGDDFVETFPVNENWLKDCSEFQEFRVKVNQKSISATFAKPIN